MGEGRIEFAVGARFGNNDPLIDGARRLLDPLQLTLSRRKARIEQNPDKCNPRHEVAQQAQPFRLHEPRQQRDAGGVAAGPVPALDQADTDRIAAQPEHDRDGRGRALGGECRRLAAGRRQHVHSAAYQLGRHRGQQIVLTARPAKLNRDVLALDKAAFGEAAAEGGDEMFGVLRRA